MGYPRSFRAWARVAVAAGVLLSVAGCDEDVRPPMGRVEDQPPRAVLAISDETVEPGQLVTVTWEPPADSVWGIDGQLRSGGKRIAWIGSGAEHKKMGTIWSMKGAAFIDIGYSGNKEWEWRVPQRLEPGEYELRKETFLNSETVEEGTLVGTARFEVVS
jgi:hypothetical protein